MSIDSDLHRGTAAGPAYPVSEWAQWHADRERVLQEQHGWLSLTGFHWLPATPAALEGLPGRWQADPTGARGSFAAGDGLQLWEGSDSSSDGIHETGAHESGVHEAGVHEAVVDEQGSLRWLRWGERQIELARRGGRYAIRIRDPHASARTEFPGVPTYPLDPVWRRPATVKPRSEPEVVDVDTARSDLRQQARLDADVIVELPDGSDVQLAATAGADGGWSILFHDTTNGVDTARWRVVFASAPDTAGQVTIDFNRALNMPFSFSDFGTCPAPVPGNVIPVAVTAGELAPVRTSR
ncbi:DUF1684 domain-containing protein [Nakamurella sp. A5-74]|uniref:DUF1684 domain-containing protein n=1 Tax=Nakamurella sp. A5-74 TaxID=3158264 RepID=A0AAU8DT21_9ACTN